MKAERDQKERRIRLATEVLLSLNLVWCVTNNNHY
jgi:hypothetical protein